MSVRLDSWHIMLWVLYVNRRFSSDPWPFMCANFAVSVQCYITYIRNNITCICIEQFHKVLGISFACIHKNLTYSCNMYTAVRMTINYKLMLNPTHNAWWFWAHISNYFLCISIPIILIADLYIRYRMILGSCYMVVS